MNGTICRVVFYLRDGRKITVYPAGGSWWQYGAPLSGLLHPGFLDEVWALLDVWDMLPEPKEDD